MLTTNMQTAAEDSKKMIQIVACFFAGFLQGLTRLPLLVEAHELA